ncbi:MAG TPA: ABC transporter substrate-binding protein, partial [Acidimicrobiales bacterium]|nr:ABC transporter substrate-binding protein [Acidimicrobiales bacterium]
MRPIWRNVLAVLAVVALVATGCGKSSKKSSSASPTGGQKSGGTFVYGASSDPVSMDGAYVSDGESLRVVDQIFETLVTLKPGGYDIVPKLAKTWDANSAGTEWTFHLESGVKFQDGTAFDGKAVCFNFDRWYHFKGVQQNPSVSYYWSTVFGGFATHEDTSVPTTSLYKSCSAPDATTAVISLTSPSSSFLSALVNPAFSIASPDALTKYEADKVSGTGDSPKFEGSFGSQHPIGTGPFKLESYTPNDRLVLARNTDYWGTKPFLDKVIFRPIADGAARRQALESGEIQGYDNVAPEDI